MLLYVRAQKLLCLTHAGSILADELLCGRHVAEQRVGLLHDEGGMEGWCERQCCLFALLPLRHQLADGAEYRLQIGLPLAHLLLFLLAIAKFFGILVERKRSPSQFADELGRTLFPVASPCLGIETLAHECSNLTFCPPIVHLLRLLDGTCGIQIVLCLYHPLFCLLHFGHQPVLGGTKRFLLLSEFLHLQFLSLCSGYFLSQSYASHLCLLLPRIKFAEQ